MTSQKINVLVAEDSAVIRMLLVHLLESDPMIRVIGAVSDGQAAFDFVQQNKPDVVLMDIHMPLLNGFEATRRIMETKPVPIVVCSATSDTKSVAFTFQAMEAGAIACLEKPLNRQRADFEALVADLLQTIKLMSEVKVVRRTSRKRDGIFAQAPALEPLAPSDIKIKVIGVGASTGGPQVLQTILASLPEDFPVPLLVVQHISPGFLPGLVDWLNHTTRVQTRIATHGTHPLPGHVYLAPDDLHMGIDASGTISLVQQAPENNLRPAVSFLFRSLAEVFGPNALGVLLTGMGKDGAHELKAMKDMGAITIAQDKESSVVHGMPGVAIALGGATYILSADNIAAALVALVNQSHNFAKGTDHGRS